MKYYQTVQLKQLKDYFLKFRQLTNPPVFKQGVRLFYNVS